MDIPHIHDLLKITKSISDLFKYTAVVKGKIYLNNGEPSDLNDFKHAYIGVGYNEPGHVGDLLIDEFKPVGSCQARQDTSGLAWAEYSIFLFSRTETAPFLTKDLVISGLYEGKWSWNLGSGLVAIVPKDESAPRTFRLTNKETLVIDMITWPEKIW